MSIVPNPIMENAVFRHKSGLSLTRSVLKRSMGGDGNNILVGTARCLFGVPDPKQAKDVVRETELKNAINFGKRYNFDIVNGEPFPYAKRRKVSHSEDSDEENRIGTHPIGDMKDVENDNEGYVWTETYNQDQMAVFNKQAILVPNQYSAPAVSLFCAITTVHINQVFIPNLSSASLDNSYSSSQTEESSSKSSPSSQSEIFSNTCTTAIIPSPLNLVSSNETNNNNIINKSHPNPSSITNITEKKLNRNCSNSYHSHRNTYRHHQSFAKKSSLSIAHQILTKYANRVLRHAVKKPRKTIITGNLQKKNLHAISLLYIHI